LQYVSDLVEGKLEVVHGDVLNVDCSSFFPSKLAQSWDEGTHILYYV